MLVVIVQSAFEWFVTEFWGRYGPFAGILAGVSFLAIFIGAMYVILSYGFRLL